jgi:hypothetical protein
MLRACQAYPQSVFVDALSVLGIPSERLRRCSEGLRRCSEGLRRCSERVRHTLRASSSML